MMHDGYVFFPFQCIERDKKCNLHVALHSCYGGTKERFVTAPGGRHYGRYAVKNNLIILYPMALDCHDTRGLTGPDYATKNGKQPKAIKKMIDRIVSKI